MSNRLMPRDLAARTPALYATDGQGNDVIVQARYYLDRTYWEWFLIEYDGEDLCFGLVSGFEVELGYFTLSELESAAEFISDKVRLDTDFEPKPLADVREQLNR